MQSSILARFDDIDPSTSERVAIRSILSPLDPGMANAPMHRYLAKHPPASHRSTNSLIRQMGAVSAGQVERYQEKYAEFRNEVQEFFFRLHDR